MAVDIQAPRIEKSGPLALAGLAERFAFGDAQRIPLLWQRFGPFIGTIPGQVGFTTFGVMSNGDADGFEYLAAVEVASLDGLPADLKRIALPARSYAVFVHSGSITTFRTTMDAIWTSWLPASGVRKLDAPYFERYGDAFDPQTGNGTIDIWLPIEA